MYLISVKGHSSNTAQEATAIALSRLAPLLCQGAMIYVHRTKLSKDSSGLDVSELTVSVVQRVANKGSRRHDSFDLEKEISELEYVKFLDRDGRAIGERRSKRYREIEQYASMDPSAITEIGDIDSVEALHLQEKIQTSFSSAGLQGKRYTIVQGRPYPNIVGPILTDE